jgi:hypothetical protein
MRYDSAHERKIATVEIRSCTKMQGWMHTMAPLITWVLVVYGATLIVTGSIIMRPLRALAARWSPWLGKLFECPMCFGFWAGVGAHLLGAGPAVHWPWPFGVIADGCAASAACWSCHVVLAYLGAEKL